MQGLSFIPQGCEGTDYIDELTMNTVVSGVEEEYVVYRLYR